MLVEFFGLPTSGKTTLAKALSERLSQQNTPTQYLSPVARKLMAEAQKETKYISRRKERVGTFGATWYGQKNPQVFHYLSHFTADHPRRILSNLEFLSELYFAAPEISKPGFVITDEGLIHRGIAASVGRNDTTQLVEYLNVLPRNQVYVHVEISVQDAKQRSLELRNKLPYSRGYSNRQPEEILAETGQLTQIAALHGKDSGLAMTTLDGTQSTEQQVDQLLASGVLPDQ